MKKRGINRALPSKLKAQAFVDAYCGRCQFDGPAAAAAAGYTGSPKVLKVQACRLLGKWDVMSAIQERMRVAFNQGIADAEECLARLTAHLRGDIGDFIHVDEQHSQGVFDLRAAQQAKKLGLIKKYRCRSRKGVDPFGNPYETVTLDIELHDAQKAAELLLKMGHLRGSATPSPPSPKTLEEKRRAVLECYLKLGTPKEEWIPSVRALYERERRNQQVATPEVVTTCNMAIRAD